MDASYFRKYSLGLRMGAVPKVWHDSGFLKSAPTLRELAAKIGVDPDGLEATVARFNGFAATGKDLDFKRGDQAYDLVYADRTHNPSPTPARKSLAWGQSVSVRVTLGWPCLHKKKKKNK